MEIKDTVKIYENWTDEEQYNLDQHIKARIIDNHMLDLSKRGKTVLKHLIGDFEHEKEKTPAHMYWDNNHLINAKGNVFHASLVLNTVDIISNKEFEEIHKQIELPCVDENGEEIE